jgi:signal transduction histidine kinase
LAAERTPSHQDIRRVGRLAGAEIIAIARLVEDLLLLARSEQRNFLGIEAIHVRPFVCDIWDGLSVTAERRFEIGTAPDGTLRADPDRFAQALRNLARKAIEQTSEGGLVRLAVEPASPGKCRVSVLDNGSGNSGRGARTHL